MSPYTARWGAALLASLACSCQLSGDLPEESPPLFEMQEPLELFEEPQDEQQRAELAPGSFSGVYVTDARRSLDALVGEGQGVVVESVIENSPGRAAGLNEGDRLLAVEINGIERDIAWPSEWRKLELESEAGTTVVIFYERNGLERECRLTLVPRVQPPARRAVERYREEQRVGVVVRTATEVEAREAGLAPGGGAVVVGMTAECPWRPAGVEFGDLIVAIDEQSVDDPRMVMEAIRVAEDGASVELGVIRGGESTTIEAPISERVQRTRRVHVPLLVSYKNERKRVEFSMLFGLWRFRRTPAAWDARLLWLISWSGGDADRLEKVEH